MCTLEQFRHKLARRLREEAGRRRRACADDPSGQDLKVIALCEQLAMGAEQLPAPQWQRLQHICRDEVAAHHFEEIWDAWPEALGLVLWPRDAAALVDWICEHAERDAGALPSRRLRVAASSGAPDDRPGKRRGLGEAGWGTAIAIDFTAGLGIAAPALAVWQVSVGIGQWRAQAFAAAHPTVTATVLSVATDSASRDIRPASTATLSFVPAAGEPACHVAVPFGPNMGAAGSMLAVTPRSVDCAAPLVASTIGDPTTSFALAAVFLASGLASLKAWSRLSRRGRRRQPKPPTLVRTLPIAL